MSNTSSGGTARSQRYAKFIVEHRAWIVAATTLIALALGSGGRFLVFEDSYRYFFREDNPQRAAFDELENVYGKSDGILFVIAPADGTIFREDFLKSVSELTAAAWKLPNASRVDSITNFQHTRANGDELVVTDLVPAGVPLDAAALTQIERVAKAEPLLYRRLVAADGRATAVNVTLELPGKVAGEQEPAVAAARKLADDLMRRAPALRVRLTGLAMMGNAFAESALSDLVTLTPAMYLIIIAVAFFFLRSISATFITVSVIGLACATGMGCAGWLGIKLTPPSTNATTMVMTLAVADSLHILIAIIAELRAGKGRHQAVFDALSVNLWPVFLTSSTTVVGLLAMNFSDVRPLNDLGNISTFGVLAAWSLTITFLPALAAMLPIRPGNERSDLTPAFTRLAGFVERRRNAILWYATVASIALTLFVGRNELDDRFVEYFDDSVVFRRDTDFTVERLTGIYTLDFSIPSGKSGGVSDPAYLRTLEEFATWFRAQPGVVHVSSLSDTFKRLHRSMNGDDAGHYAVPTSRELAAQYLLLYELSLPYGLDLNNQINVDKSHSRFVVTTGEVTASTLRDLAARGEAWLRAKAPAYQASASSTSLMFAHISQQNIESMFTGTLYSFLIIAGILVFSLRSVKIGLLSLLPNLLPSVAAFGLWGLWVGQVNLGLSMVAAVSFGIIVDDTVYFLSKYMRARQRLAYSPPQAVRYALETVGPAMLVTSVILVSGFLVLACSSFSLNSDLGKLTAAVLGLGMFGDLLFLPAILLLLDRSPEPALSSIREADAVQNVAE